MLFFIDPFGYKGISAKLINALVKDWGSDCIFFFNFNRINAAINNSKVTSLVNAIFGESVANLIRNEVTQLNAVEREELIIDKISSVLSNDNENFVLPFKFISTKRNATSHYLIFVSKHLLGYEIMKDIMYNISSEYDCGIGSFSYISTRNRQLNFLYSLSRPLEDLKNKLLVKFSGKTFTVKQIYDLDNINTPYVLKNYKDVLLQLEMENKIITRPPYDERRNYRGKKSMGNNVSITFY
nr:three-Cys-motif partner protein TcmP [Clostridium kluyveri]